MHYFKNVELAKLYPVSESAVRKWIDAARQGKLDLQLYEHNGKPHIANTAKNQRTIEELVEKGKKFKNSRGHKVVTPKAEFYELYDKKQILDIISSIEIHHEIPFQYGYFDGGADYWDKYAQRLWGEDDENLLLGSIALLRANFGNLDSLLENYDRVNVIDLGVGNCLPVKELLTYLLYDRAILGRYIGIDISREMLDIAQQNIEKWFEGRINFERYERDFTYERFDDLVVDETLNVGAERTVNLILLLGGTLANFRSPDDVLHVVRGSMGRDDLFLLSTKLDSDEARRYFDFVVESSLPKLSQNDKFVLDLLGIEDSYYEVEQGYDEAKGQRYIRITLKTDLTINLQFDVGKKSVELHKGDSLLVWRYTHQGVNDALRQLQRSGLALLQASATRNRHYLLTISEVEGDSRANDL